MSAYRHERMLWTDGFGETHDVVRFYVPGDEADWATYVIRADGCLERLMAMGPVFMRTERGYATIEQAAAAVEAAHREWLESDAESWRQAIGVLAGIDTRPAGAGACRPGDGEGGEAMSGTMFVIDRKNSCEWFTVRGMQEPPIVEFHDVNMTEPLELTPDEAREIAQALTEAADYAGRPAGAGEGAET